ncbi:hypothetical protein GF326_01750 [Candidatus Bathyarchaeota archaeon]|nr:hypothetical protein [Candidatus Bathyarchaeota archaeon]
MRLKEILAGLTLAVICVVAVASVYPALDDFWVENPSWNGLSEFYGLVDPVRVRGIEDLLGIDPVNSTLFIIGPSRGFNEGYIEVLRGYLGDGGRVVLLDDFGSGNELLEGLSLETRFSGALLRDGVFFDPRPEFPRLLNFSFYETEEVVFNYGTVLVPGEAAYVLIRSTPLSYTNTSTDGLETGAFPVVTGVRVGEGLLVLISDSSIWLNSMIDRGDNREFLIDFMRGRCLIDVGHSYPTKLLAFKWWLMDLYSFLNIVEIRYGLALLMVFFVFIIQMNIDEAEERDSIEEVLKMHPDWNKEQLEWLSEQQRDH